MNTIAPLILILGAIVQIITLLTVMFLIGKHTGVINTRLEYLTLAINEVKETIKEHVASDSIIAKTLNDNVTGIKLDVAKLLGRFWDGSERRKT